MQPDTATVPITKRLHISGLTPAISSHHLSHRLGTFGTVAALDGLGKLDALGQPRKFAYVTLETTKTQLSKCMNVLSGSTWKGAKLRIGEAKPDFRERISLENASQAQTEETPPRKRRRLARGVHGRHAQDMSLVTPENVHQRPQWCVTPLGRLIRPMRMRPARPLDPPLDTLKTQNIPNGKDKGKRKRARVVPPTRARKQTIDPLRWGSTHLSGVFLDGARVALPPTLVASGEGGTNGESTEVEADEEVEELLAASQSPANDDSDIPSRADPPTLRPERPLAQPRATTSPQSSPPPIDAVGADLAEETARALKLLNSMFGEANQDWGGAESVDSDMEQAAAAPTREDVPHASEPPLDSMDFETVPAAQRDSSVNRQMLTAAPRNPEPVQLSTKLKDLFAPREEEGFSLIGHLDLDSELDFDMDEPALANDAPAPASASTSDPTNHAAATSALAQPPGALDATLPFFFPKSTNSRGDVRRAAIRFARTEDEAQIRLRWEAARGELTREWKRRHREAVKSRRRRGGVAG
ncbi:hypothetical protein BJV78DRAFT_1233136 [Lactifluus subvellereus]|nr:hypothetical protein BJV78DRAFT_1233136 [Lactifluus subvellereus]